ncbi:MAG: hypothetical protein ACPHF4_09480, partial [Rubripirellula sp.]
SDFGEIPAVGGWCLLEFGEIASLFRPLTLARLVKTWRTPKSWRCGAVQVIGMTLSWFYLTAFVTA